MEIPQTILYSKEKDHPSNVITNGSLNFNMLIRKKRLDQDNKTSSTTHKYLSTRKKDQLAMVCTTAGHYVKFTVTILKDSIK